ncbi:phosphoenolpyruvate carboxykinase (ATP) [Thermoflexibacter ruber]|uniref:Phosphoenolpyruvate carboxykinase (ATP) n=1 Tax=Thermoflexibacter ruber TaxID=1003 RepID=A0A1I2FJR4_9BACT|nr:phosphoenolpyruvate carboxykinase (ATP) [Thermoflexibacter ruber]SFF05525.1 phosphoenolpyruvate carboxykinase (ATP) [Thermoflexibacter ruber]
MNNILDSIKAGQIFYNLSPAELVEHALKNGEGTLTDTGALACDTGKFTGRAPKDRYIVEDEISKNKVWWGNINQSFSSEKFDRLLDKMIAFAQGKNLYVREAYVGADDAYRMNIRVIGTQAFHNLFAYNMFLRPTKEETGNMSIDFTVFSLPEFQANPQQDGTKNPNFVIINFTKKLVIIGGTSYTGETKKSIFSILNFLLPTERNVFTMHCSANIGEKGDTAVFFGLSGTGKTTLSADPNRYLIGDDEHGWTDHSVFNFEGGCYAKAINLSKENEPDIYHAIRFGAIVENTRYFAGTRTVNYADNSVTDNTRVSYPLYHIQKIAQPSVGGIPKNIFFLTCDSFGILPPISKLTVGQAMFHFISGYTAKVGGTEVGIKEPVPTFSACFGAPFMPLHPTTYAEMLGKKIKEHQTNVWLINTGWTGGKYGTGKRMKLSFTRAMITAALNGELENVPYEPHPFFGVLVPQSCPHVPNEILNPRDTWANKDEYDEQANHLADLFLHNFEEFREYANEEIMSGAPMVMEGVGEGKEKKLKRYE